MTNVDDDLVLLADQLVADLNGTSNRESQVSLLANALQSERKHRARVSEQLPNRESYEPLLRRLWDSDAASALTNEAAREIETLLRSVKWGGFR